MIRRDENGFALIELLVGLALLAIAVTLMPGALRLGARAWEARGDLERASDVTLALAMLERRIAEASPVYERDATGRGGVAFTGDSRTLTFVSPAENGPAGAGVYRHRLEPGATQGGGLLLRLSLFAPGAGEAGQPGGGETRLLIPEHATVRFRYFGLQRSDEQPEQPALPQWHDNWRRTDAFPSLVELTLAAGTGAPGVTRRMIVAPRLDARP